MRAVKGSERRRMLVDRIDAAAPEWKEIALRIHAHPELGLQEKQASGWLADGLTRHGFAVEGRKRRHYRRRNGELWDAVMMGLVLEEDAPDG